MGLFEDLSAQGRTIVLITHARPPPTGAWPPAAPVEHRPTAQAALPRIRRRGSVEGAKPRLRLLAAGTCRRARRPPRSARRDAGVTSSSRQDGLERCLGELFVAAGSRRRHERSSEPRTGSLSSRRGGATMRRMLGLPLPGCSSSLAVGASGCATQPRDGQVASSTSTARRRRSRWAARPTSRSPRSSAWSTTRRCRPTSRTSAAGSPRSPSVPGLPWTFKVIDDPVVNAFALPGGFIYVTRGLLAPRALGGRARLGGRPRDRPRHRPARRQPDVEAAGRDGRTDRRHDRGARARGRGGPGPGGARPALPQVRPRRRAPGRRPRAALHGQHRLRDARDAEDVRACSRRWGEIAGAGRIPNWLASHPEPALRASARRA